jgi:predicted lipoprotein
MNRSKKSSSFTSERFQKPLTKACDRCAPTQAAHSIFSFRPSLKMLMPKKSMSIRLWALMAIIALGSLFGIIGCFDGGTQNRDVNFDRQGLLTHWADHLVLPAYRNLAEATETLEAEIEAFTETPDSARAMAARAALRQAWLAWQSTSAYEFGPAAEAILRQRMNTFPTNTGRIENNIAAGTWDLEIVTNLTAKGFPALDYLLHASEIEGGDLISLFTDSVNSDSRRAYTRALALEVAAQSKAVLKAWESSEGNYRAEFIDKQGTDIGSSLGEAVNQFIFDYELLKNPKIGIPLGIKTLGDPLEKQVEGYYAGYSLELAKAQIAASENFFRGRTEDDVEGIDGIGLDDYLLALGDRYQSGELAQSILDQYAAATAALNAIPAPLSQAILDETELVQKAYEELQRMVVLIKTDLSSALSISITYQDNDGD